MSWKSKKPLNGPYIHIMEEDSLVAIVPDVRMIGGSTGVQFSRARLIMNAPHLHDRLKAVYMDCIYSRRYNVCHPLMVETETLLSELRGGPL